MHHSYALRRVVGDVGDGGLTFGGAHAGLHRRRAFEIGDEDAEVRRVLAVERGGIAVRIGLHTGNFLGQRHVRFAVIFFEMLGIVGLRIEYDHLVHWLFLPGWPATFV